MIQEQSTPRAIIYCRANPRLSDAVSEYLSRQERRCAEYIEDEGWIVVEVVRDVSASGHLERDGLATLTWDIIASHPDVVVVDMFERISSDPRQLRQFADRLSEIGIVLEAAVQSEG